MADTQIGYPHPESGALLYWRNEQSGLLAIAVHRYLNRLPLHPDLIGHLRDYCHHWISFDGYVIDPDLAEEWREVRASVLDIKTTQDLDRWVEAALSLGIDPF